MWQAVERLGEQIKSGFSFNFISRLFQKRSYSQFDGQEDVFRNDTENGTPGEYEDEDRILMNSDDALVVAYASVQERCSIEQDPSSGSSHIADISQRHRGDDGYPSSDDDAHCDIRDTKPFVRNRKQQTDRTTDAYSLMSSAIQRQYSRLEETEDIPDSDIRIDDDDQSEDTTPNETMVFNSYKDVMPKPKAKKPKRRKKIAKRTRRAIRSSWKWVRAGFSSYANAFNPPKFFIISATGAAVNRTTTYR